MMSYFVGKSPKGKILIQLAVEDLEPQTKKLYDTRDRSQEENVVLVTKLFQNQ